MGRFLVVETGIWACASESGRSGGELAERER